MEPPFFLIYGSMVPGRLTESQAESLYPGPANAGSSAREIFQSPASGAGIAPGRVITGVPAACAPVREKTHGSAISNAAMKVDTHTLFEDIIPGVPAGNWRRERGPD